MHNLNTTPQGARQVFGRQRARRKYDWLRGSHGREVRTQHNVGPHLVAKLAGEISGYPSFVEHGEVWGGRI